jgi:ribosome-binding factor A
MSRVLKEAVSEVIVAELSDPRMGFITVTEVEPSPDLKTAKVKVSILGTEAVMRRTMQGLRAATGFVQREVAGKVAMRNVPVLLFVEDDSVKRSVRISQIIAEAVKDIKEPEEPGDSSETEQEDQ